NGGNGIDREDKIRTLDDQQDQKERRCHQLPGTADEKLASFKILCDRHKPSEKFDNRILVWLQVLTMLPCHADTREDQKGPKDINDPMELLEQCRADDDQCAAHDQCAEDAPEQDTVLV